MTKRYRYILASIIIMVLLLSVSVTIAYLYTSGVTDTNRTIGLVKIDPTMYHINSDNSTTLAREVLITDINVEPNVSYAKPGVYELNITDTASNYYIDKFRIDYTIESNVDTYIRVKLKTSLVFTYRDNTNKLREIFNPFDDIGTERVNFSIADSNWHYDENSEFYYYKVPVNKDDNRLISFITGGLMFQSMSPQYTIQLTMNYEAVQAHLGPEKVWGMEKNPWDGGSWLWNEL